MYRQGLPRVRELVTPKKILNRFSSALFTRDFIIAIAGAIVGAFLILVGENYRDAHEKKAILRNGYTWLSQELADDYDWIIVRRMGKSERDKADARVRLESRKLLPGMSTVSVSALRYVITAVGPTHLISTEDYRTLVTLEDTLSILRNEFKIEEEVRATTTGNLSNWRNPEPIMHRQDLTMDMALDQLKEARNMVKRQLSRW